MIEISTVQVEMNFTIFGLESALGSLLIMCTKLHKPRTTAIVMRRDVLSLILTIGLEAIATSRYETTSCRWSI